jgi:hypothetical protein
VVLIACSTPAATPKPFSDDLDLPREPVRDAEIAPVALVSRVRGDIKGGFALDRASYIVGQPIFATLELANQGTGPIEFDVGGDFGPALFPQRYQVIVRDEAGAVVCDAARDAPPPQGGGGYRAKIAPGEVFRETLVATPACKQLWTPGRYRMTVARVLTTSPSCDGVSPPDTTQLAAGAPDPYRRRDAACMAGLAAAPAVATDVSIEIRPWDVTAARAWLVVLPDDARAAAERRELSREGAISAYAQWYCERVRCGCPDDVRFERADDCLTQALSVVPAAFPATCP